MMINVLVAEDEPLILNSITKLIHSLDVENWQIFIVVQPLLQLWKQHFPQKLKSMFQ